MLREISIIPAPARDSGSNISSPSPPDRKKVLWNQIGITQNLPISVMESAVPNHKKFAVCEKPEPFLQFIESSESHKGAKNETNKNLKS